MVSNALKPVAESLQVNPTFWASERTEQRAADKVPCEVETAFRQLAVLPAVRRMLPVSACRCCVHRLPLNGQLRQRPHDLMTRKYAHKLVVL
jgi:hypothetical protein